MTLKQMLMFNSDPREAMLDWWLSLNDIYHDGYYCPVIQRKKLNIGTEKFNLIKLTILMGSHPKQEFIFPSNEAVKKKIEMLKQNGAILPKNYVNSRSNFERKLHDIDIMPKLKEEYLQYILTEYNQHTK